MTQPTPKEVVMAFIQMAFFEGRQTEAALRYYAPDVLEHDPRIVGGRDALIAHWDRPKTGSAATDHIDRVICEGDLVVVHNHLTGGARPDHVDVDIFRVQGGLIVEHWDVKQDIPADKPNPLSMY